MFAPRALLAHTQVATCTVRFRSKLDPNLGNAGTTSKVGTCKARKLMIEIGLTKCRLIGGEIKYVEMCGNGGGHRLKIPSEGDKGNGDDKTRECGFWKMWPTIWILRTFLLLLLQRLMFENSGALGALITVVTVSDRRPVHFCKIIV